MLMKKGNRPRQILAGSIRAGTIDQREGIVAFFRKLQGIREAVLHCSNIDKTASCIADGNPAARISPGKKQACILLPGIFCLLFLRVNIIENLIARRSLFTQIIYDFNRLIRVHIIVPDQNIVHIFQRKIIADCPINRENQSSIILKHRGMDHILYFSIAVHSAKSSVKP